MDVDSTRMFVSCWLGLGDVRGAATSTTRLVSRWGCMSVGGRLGRAARSVADRCALTVSGTVELVDLPAFGRPVRLVWHKRGWCCASSERSVATVTEQDREIAPPRERLTTRAGRWVTRQAGRGRTLKEVAVELGCSWHPVNGSVQPLG